MYEPNWVSTEADVCSVSVTISESGSASTDAETAITEDERGAGSVESIHQDPPRATRDCRCCSMKDALGGSGDMHAVIGVSDVVSDAAETSSVHNDASSLFPATLPWEGCDD